MGYDKETEAHLKEVQDLRDAHFIPKSVKKELKKQDKEFTSLLHDMKDSFPPETFKDTARQFLTDMLALRASKTAELILYAYSIMGSKLVLDAAMNKDLRDYIERTLSEEVAGSLEPMMDSLSHHAHLLGSSKLSSYIHMLIDQIGHCNNDIEHLTRDIKHDSWNASDAVDTAKKNFKTAVRNIASAIQPFRDTVKKDVQIHARGAEATFS